jgi:hypothetical protein
MARIKKTNTAVPGVPTELEITPDDPHYGIPRDADGLPIFYVLEPDVRRDYNVKMSRCELGWSATRHPSFVKQAQIWLRLFRQPPPLWHSEAVIALCERREGKGHAKRLFRNAQALMRYHAVCAALVVVPPRKCCILKTGRVARWRDVFEYAANAVAETRAAGAWPTVKKDYMRVKKDSKEGRGARYLTPLPTFGRKLSDVVAGKHSPKSRFGRKTTPVSIGNLGDRLRGKRSPR